MSNDGFKEDCEEPSCKWFVAAGRVVEIKRNGVSKDVLRTNKARNLLEHFIYEYVLNYKFNY
mgnify:CR=1 FL=1